MRPIVTLLHLLASVQPVPFSWAIRQLGECSDNACGGSAQCVVR